MLSLLYLRYHYTAYSTTIQPKGSLHYQGHHYTIGVIITLPGTSLHYRGHLTLIRAPLHYLNHYFNFDTNTLPMASIHYTVLVSYLFLPSIKVNEDNKMLLYFRFCLILCTLIILISKIFFHSEFLALLVI